MLQSTASQKCRLLQFDASIIKDIDGKPIKSKFYNAKVGKSMIVKDSDLRSEYKTGNEPTRSMMKMNGSFCADKFKSMVKEKNLNITVEQDEKTQVGFGRIRSIDGKVTKRKG